MALYTSVDRAMKKFLQPLRPLQPPLNSLWDQEVKNSPHARTWTRVLSAIKMDAWLARYKNGRSGPKLKWPLRPLWPRNLSFDLGFELRRPQLPMWPSFKVPLLVKKWLYLEVMTNMIPWPRIFDRGNNITMTRREIVLLAEIKAGLGLIYF